jgi:hypothetical protein
MPVHIHFRAYTPEGELCGVAQRNDTFMVALFDDREKALCPPVVFTGRTGPQSGGDPREPVDRSQGQLLNPTISTTYTGV